MNLQNIGKEIKRLRKQAGLTQQQLEDSSGVPQWHISRIESGQHEPTLKTLDALLFSLGLSVEIVPCDTTKLNPESWKELLEK